MELEGTQKSQDIPEKKGKVERFHFLISNITTK